VDYAEVFAEIDRPVSSASNIRNNVAYKSTTASSYGQQIDLNPQVACQKPTLKAPKEKRKEDRSARGARALLSWLFRWRWMEDRQSHLLSIQKGEQRLWVVHRTLSSYGSRFISSGVLSPARSVYRASIVYQPIAYWFRLVSASPNQSINSVFLS